MYQCTHFKLFLNAFMVFRYKITTYSQPNVLKPAAPSEPLASVLDATFTRTKKLCLHSKFRLRKQNHFVGFSKRLAGKNDNFRYYTRNFPGGKLNFRCSERLMRTQVKLSLKHRAVRRSQTPRHTSNDDRLIKSARFLKVK